MDKDQLFKYLRGQRKSALLKLLEDVFDELIGKMAYGEEIVFADESGSWMTPGEERVYIEAYISSPAATKSPEEYADRAADLIQRDSHQNGCRRGTLFLIPSVDQNDSPNR